MMRMLRRRAARHAMLLRANESRQTACYHTLYDDAADSAITR